MFFSLNSRTTGEELIEQERTRRRLLIWRRSFDDRIEVLEARIKALEEQNNRLWSIVHGFTDDGK